MSVNAPHPDQIRAVNLRSLWLEWLQRAAKELNLEDPETLIFTDSEGILRAPYYTADSPFANVSPIALDLPANEPSWLAVAPVSGSTTTEMNKRALHALQHGGEAIQFDFSLLSPEKVPACLSGILPQYAPLFIRGMTPQGLHAGFSNWLSAENIPFENLQGALLHDAVDLLGMDEQGWTSSMNLFEQDLPNFHPIGVDTASWRARGLSAPQETGLLWLCLYRYLSIQSGRVSTKKEHLIVTLPFTLSVGCSTEFFDELARLRALRTGVTRVAALFNAHNPSGRQFRIQPQILVRIPPESLPSEDPYTNLLRLTTMSVSSVLGGCGALSLPPFDADPSTNADSFADELSLQLQMILRHEAFPRLPIDAGEGSSYIEYLSHAQGERAWAILGELADRCTSGGTWNAAGVSDVLNDWCKAGQDRQRQNQVSGKRIRVGVDCYRVDETHLNSEAVS